MQQVIDHINQLDPHLKLKHIHSIQGGCISQAFKCESLVGKSYFLKINSASLLSMFEAEYLGLNEMHESKTILVPKPLLFGKTESNSFLLLEYVEMGGPSNWSKMGQQLAEMHRVSNEYHGWKRDNTIGATHQPNPLVKNWCDFYREHRLKFQIELARKKGLTLRKAEELFDNLPKFFDELPEPSLLHGDLWSGNADFTSSGEPIIFDPATHFGDRECDLAMTEMFGGFQMDFYRAYNEVWPIDKGYERRKGLYQLYHILNHFNLFGSGYAQQCESLISDLSSK